jgi:hypothetical protein
MGRVRTALIWFRIGSNSGSYKQRNTFLGSVTKSLFEALEGLSASQ